MAHHGGKASRLGTPQGGLISPPLAKLYMNRFLKHWRRTGRGEACQVAVVAYADDAGASVARRERFDFLGFRFGPNRFRTDGHRCLGASPSKTSAQRLQTKARDLPMPACPSWRHVAGLALTPGGELDARQSQVRFDERGWAKGDAERPKPPQPFLGSPALA